MAANVGNEMSEHSEKIRSIIQSKHQLIVSLITDVIQEAQDNNEISKNIAAADLAAFIEDAGIGAMAIMKEMKSSYPIDNFMNMVRNILLK